MKTLLSILGISLLLSSCALIPTQQELINDCVQEELERRHTIAARVFRREKQDIDDILRYCTSKYPNKD